MKKAVIIVGHGSRGGGNDAALKRLAEEVGRSAGDVLIEYAFLQFAQPSADAALNRCIAQGSRKIVIIPFFMQAGGHVTRDIPAFLDKARALHPECDIRSTDYVGAHPLMTQIVMDLVNKAK
jgi:sirohydrochlorin ferrochelatase